MQNVQNNPYGEYSEESVAVWLKIAELQRIRDSIYWKTLSKHLLPGSVLEVGAGCGQVSLLLKSYGYEVTSSDFQWYFVEHMKSMGLDSLEVDATDIAKSTDRTFDNIVAQSLSTQMRRNPEVVEQTYHSIHAALKPGGRFLSTAALYPVSMYPLVKQKRKINYRHGEHLKIIKKMSHLFKLVFVSRYQILKSTWYNERNKHLLNLIDFTAPRIFPFAACRGIYVLQKR